MVKKGSKERIAILSDSTGETAESYVRAILAMFHRANAELLRIPQIRQESQLIRELDNLSPPYLVAYTFATEKLRKLIWSETKHRGLLGIDLFYPAISVFSDFLKSSPEEKHGMLHTTEALNYFDRMEAVEYTVKHDDGQKMNDLADAEIVLTGVSRTSKTPTSMYLAHKGYRVANVPLVHGVPAPQSMIEAHQRGVPVIMLSIEAHNLEKIRRSRFQKLGTAPKASDTYIDVHKINEELEAAHQLAKRHRWPIIDVTSKAIEETASEILLIVTSKER